MFHLEAPTTVLFALSAIDWIRSPLEVPIPTQREASPWLLVGGAGRTRVEVDSRMKELEATGPVLKAGPKAALVPATAITARALIIWLQEGIFVVYVL